VPSHHGVEITLDQRQMGEMIERGPVILGVVLALGDWTVQLLVAQTCVLRE
jgi:hypothetical protein